MMLSFDKDSPIPFRPDGHSVHDFDLRFQLEEVKLIPKDSTFRWKFLEPYRNREV